MIKKFTLPLLFIGFTIYGHTQSIERSVIATAGGSDKTDHVALDWTMGEIAIETAVISNGLLTQGFHQPLLVYPVKPAVIAALPPVSGYSIKVFPNPVQSVLNVSLQSINDSRVVVQLSDINGKTFYTTSTHSKGNNLKINMHSFAAGTYLLIVTTSTGLIINTFRIVKSS